MQRCAFRRQMWKEMRADPEAKFAERTKIIFWSDGGSKHFKCSSQPGFNLPITRMLVSEDYLQLF